MKDTNNSALTPVTDYLIDYHCSQQKPDMKIWLDGLHVYSKKKDVELKSSRAPCKYMLYRISANLIVLRRKVPVSIAKCQLKVIRDQIRPRQLVWKTETPFRGQLSFSLNTQ